MGKRVGITSDPVEREKYWRSQYPSLHSWRIRDRGLTYEQAQREENKYIKMGYEGSPGGKKKPGNIYYVYTFEY